MRIQEAIKVLKSMNVNYGYWIDDTDIAKDMAIAALEKQIPKKCRFYARNHYCPSCDELVGNSEFGWKHMFCSKCGQSIDWSDEK